MSLMEKMKPTPDYYPSMYLDGYSPEEILNAAHRTMMKNYLGDLNDPDDSPDFSHVKFKTEITIKK